MFLASNHTAEWAQLGWEGWWTMLLFLLFFVFLVWERFPADVTAVATAGLMVMTGVISPDQFVSSFTQQIIVILAMLFTIARTLELNGVLNLAAEWILPKRGGPRVQMAAITAPVALVSAFFNNTPLVLMMVPVARKWARDQSRLLSKFLIPLSYAAILGGACTLIGTATNIIVDGLMRHSTPSASFGFFELTWVALPCALFGLIYLIFVSPFVVPKRVDPSETLAKEAVDFTGEFLVEEGALIGKTIHEATRRLFQGALLIEIQGEPPTPSQVIHAGDRLVFAGDMEQIARLHAVDGLSSTVDPHFHLSADSPRISEVVVAPTSRLAGKTLRKSRFRSQYGVTVLAIYRQGRRISEAVAETPLRPGDVLMLLGERLQMRQHYFGDDLYFIRSEEEFPVLRPIRAGLSIVVLALMITSIILGAPMVVATTSAAVALLLAGGIRPRQAVRSIEWPLLLLVGSAFAIGEGLVSSGVADRFAQLLLLLTGDSPTLLIGAIFLLTMMVTEVITNNAAALLIFPIAHEMALLAGYTGVSALKAVGVAVALAASYSFLTPIGYQTNTIVYGPGGYRFYDYARVGLPLTVAVWLIGTTLIPILWPLA